MDLADSIALTLFLSGLQLHQGPLQGPRAAHEKQEGLQLSRVCPQHQ